MSTFAEQKRTKNMININRKMKNKIFEQQKRFDTKIFDELAELQKLKELNRKSNKTKELKDKIELDLNLKVKKLMEKNSIFGLGFFSDGQNQDQYILEENFTL